MVMAQDLQDLETLWSIWLEHSQALSVAVHAYLFDAQHMTALLTPVDAQGVGSLMQAIGRQYVQRFNRRHHRLGSLWSARYRSVLIEAERWALPLMTLMGDPRRGGELQSSTQAVFRSSEKHYTGAQFDALITPHREVWRLGNTPFAREAAYTEMVHLGLNPADVLLMKSALKSGLPLGGGQFVANLQNQTQQRLTPARRGRPSKSN
jgi:putative transposase